MAREEHDREDLLAEATALVERAELHVSGELEPVVAGFRRDGAASVFFGGDTAYHFNSAGQLRRAYGQGRLYKAERGQLVSLERHRVRGEVQLLRHALTDVETSDFLLQLDRNIGSLRSALARGDFDVTGQVPHTVDVVGRIRHWLDELSLPPPIAATPRLGK